MEIVRKLWRDQRGVSVVFVMVAMPVVIAMAGLVIDGGILMMTKLQLDNAVDAASLAATQGYDQEIWENEGQVVILQSDAEILARQYLTANMPRSTLRSVEVNPNSPNHVKVTAEAKAPVFFMQMFGINTRTIVSSTESSAR